MQAGKRRFPFPCLPFKGYIMPRANIEEILKKHTDKLMSVPGVVGIAQGEFKGVPCIRIFVVRKTSALLKHVPNQLGGYRVIVEESGEFRASLKRI
jgi:hypothetical protein